MQLPKQSNSNLLAPLFKNLLLLTTGGVGLTIILFFLSVSQIFNRLGQMLIPSLSEPEIEIPTLVLTQIKEASQLTTAVFVMEAIVPTSQSAKLGDLVIGNTKLLYIGYGEVKAGIDLNKLTDKDIQIIDNKTIKINLPAPEIIDSKIDVNRSRVYDYNRGFFNLGPDVAPQLQTLAQRKTLDKIVTTACDRGILMEANEKAEIVVSKLLTTAGFNQIKIKTNLPQTCQANS